jgi:type I restriction enzyme, S subunit
MVIYDKVKLGSLGKIVTGKTPPTNNPNNYGNDYMFIGPTDLNKHFIINQSEKRISSQGLRSIKGSIINGLSVLVGCIGWDMGNVGLVEATCATNQQINAITEFKPHINPYYVYYWLKNKKQFLFQKASVTRTPILNKTDFSNLEIAIPNKHYQDKVVESLYAMDRKIELNNRINAELEAMAKTIYDYWFVQFDFPISKEQAKAIGKPKLEGKPYKASGGKMVWAEELKREVPEGWETKQLAAILKLNYESFGKNTTMMSVNYLDTSSLTSNRIDGVQSIDCNKDVLPSRAQRIVKKNDILYSTVRPNQEHHGIIKEPIENMIASTGFAQLSSKDDSIGNDLIYTFLKSEWVTERLQQVANSSVSAYPSISPNDILSQYIALPIDKTFLKYSNDRLDTIYLMVSANQLQNQKLSELRDWLLPMLMNGQVKIKETIRSKVVKPAISLGKPGKSYFHQAQLVAAIVKASKKHKITHGEMTLAKYTYLIDKLYGVPTYFNYECLHLGPYPKEMKKIVNNKKFFNIQNNEVSVVPQEKEYNYQFQRQVEEAVAELASLFSQHKGRERSHQTELLATVCKVVEDIRSTNLKEVRESMKNWRIYLKTSKFKNKAEKFTNTETKDTLKLLFDRGWEKPLMQ